MFKVAVRGIGAGIGLFIIPVCPRFRAPGELPPTREEQPVYHNRTITLSNMAADIVDPCQPNQACQESSPRLKGVAGRIGGSPQP